MLSLLFALPLKLLYFLVFFYHHEVRQLIAHFVSEKKLESLKKNITEIICERDNYDKKLTWLGTKAIKVILKQFLNPFNINLLFPTLHLLSLFTPFFTHFYLFCCFYCFARHRNKKIMLCNECRRRTTTTKKGKRISLCGQIIPILANYLVNSNQSSWQRTLSKKLLLHE